MKVDTKQFTNLLLLFSVGVFLFGSGYKYAEWQIRENARSQGAGTIFNAKNSTAKQDGEPIDFSLFWEAWEKVETKYIDKSKVDPQKMYYGAIKGMVASIDDPYTFFLTPEEQKQSKDDLGGKFQGIGAQLGLKEGRIVVIAPLKDSPAERAGVRAGDFILKVDGEETKDWTLTQAVSKIRGPENTEVVLTLFRAGKELETPITRQEIKVPSLELSYETLDGSTVAYVKLNQFGDSTNSEWDKATREIADRYRKGTVKGLVLDVRSNPGGYLDSAVHIASEFVPRGTLIVKQETTNSNDRVYNAQRTGVFQDIPAVVIINQGSASASEILAGALRDHKRATLLGEKSFGKGSVQEALDLSDGAGLHVTISKWILPNGDWINGKGIEPEIVVTNELDTENTTTKETDEQLEKAIETVLKK